MYLLTIEIQMAKPGMEYFSGMQSSQEELRRLSASVYGKSDGKVNLNLSIS